MKNVITRVEGMKSLPICDLIYCVAHDTARPPPKMSNGNKYVLLVVDHYSKWCETCPIKEHDATTTTIFLEEKIICSFGVPKYVITNIGNEWMKEFDALC
jgi:hypothetical protein